jgi:glycine/D-amino acid oxidase-like deaminating enzyme/predicted heme/steroid binding protein
MAAGGLTGLAFYTWSEISHRERVHAISMCSPEVAPSEAAEEGIVDVVTMEEVSRHNTKDDCWMVIDGKVYDVTSFLENHPGGASIMAAHGGMDVSKHYRYLQHSENAQALRSGLYIADVKDYTPTKKKVLIIGAGICGVSAAYHLSQMAHFDVNVIESGPMVGGTALKSSAILFLGALLEKDDEKGSATAWTGDESVRIHHELQQQEDIEFEFKSVLGVCQTDEQWMMAQKLYGPGGKREGTGKLVTIDELMVLEPQVNPNLKGAVLNGGATMDPYLTCEAFAKRARSNGSKFNFGVDVTGMERRPEGGFRVLTTVDGRPTVMEADEVLICTGWIASTMAKWLGHNVPVKPMHGQMFATTHPDIQLKHSLYSWEGPHYWATHKDPERSTLDAAEPHERTTRHLYGNQIANGTLKFGGDRVAAYLDNETIPAGIQMSFDHICEVLPAIKECEIVGSWAGTMPFTPDQKLILGPLEPGLFVLTGAPFTKGAVAGKMLAALVAGNPSAYAEQLKEFDPARFPQVKETAEAA